MKDQGATAEEIFQYMKQNGFPDLTYEKLLYELNELVQDGFVEREEIEEN